MGGMISSLVFQPPSMTYLHSTKHKWLLTRTQNRIPYFFIDRNSSVTVLFSHGNAEDLGIIYDSFVDYSKQLQVNVMAYDYTGYGKSSGVVSEENCYADVDAAYEHLTEVLKIPSTQIILHGRSLGSGPTCYLAERLAAQGEQLLGIILQSPLASAFRVAVNFRITMPGDMFANIDRIGGICCPIFVIHGTRDEVVPFWHGQELFMNARPKWRAKPFWVDGAGHNNIEVLLKTDRTFYERIQGFIDEAQVAVSPQNVKQEPE